MLSSVFGLLWRSKVPQSSHTYSDTVAVTRIVWTIAYLLTMPKKEEKGQVYCLVNCCVCCAKNVVHAFATLVEKSVTASTVLL